MNRTVKAFLAIAVAIIYPTFVYLAVVTFLPVKTQEPRIQEPQYPKSPTCYRESNYPNNESSTSSSYSLTMGNTDCEKQWSDYDRAVLDFDEQGAAYNKQMHDANALRGSRNHDRASLAIIFGLIGLVAIYFIREISALVIGFAVASASILTVAVGGLGDTTEGVKNPVGSILSLLSFVIIVVMIWLVDTKLFPKPMPAPSPPNETK